MTAFNSEPLTYDPNGNLLNDGTNTYTWDSRNDLASLAGPTSAGFTYDSFGRRVSLTVNGGTKQYLYDATESGMPLQELSTTGTPILSGLGTSRADLSGNMTFLKDSSGDTIALTDDSGALQTQYSYDPFGMVMVSGTASTNPYQYESSQNDGTSLYYFWDGYYGPSFGRNVGGGTIGIGGSKVSNFVSLSNPVSPNTTSGGTGSCDSCRAELRYYYVPGVSLLGIPVVHSWWDTWDQSSPNRITHIEGESSAGYFDGYLYASIFWTSPSGTVGALVKGFGPSCDLCNKTHEMNNVAQTITPFLEIPYNVLLGPNCNSLSNFLGNNVAGFGVSPTFLISIEGWYQPLGEYYY
jgi:YD repeat-containing protein